MLLFVWIAFSLLWQSWNLSVTFDEIVHLPAGYTYIQKRDFRVNPEHPVLVKILAAIPWKIIAPNQNIEETLWKKSNIFYYDNWINDRKLGEDLLFLQAENPRLILFSGRVMLSAITIFMIFSIFYYLIKKQHNKAGMIFLVLSSFCPQFLGYGYLVTTDIAIAGSSFLALILFYKLLRNQNNNYAILWGLSLGLMALSKYTSLIFFVFFVFFYFIYKYWFDKKVSLKFLFISLITGYFLIFFVYLFGKTIIAPVFVPSEQIYNATYIFAKEPYLNIVNNIFRYLLIPALYFKGLIHVIVHTTVGHSSYLLGQSSKSGWWYYFPLAFILKNSISLILILIVAFFQKNYFKKLDFEKKILWLGMITYIVFAVFSKTNLGIRHLMPIYPILLYLVSYALAEIKIKWKNIAVGSLLAIYCLSSVRANGNYMTFFSEIIGSLDNGSKYLVDSNLDWGQNLYALAQYQKDNNIDNIYFGSFIANKTICDFYNIKYIPITNENVNNSGYFVIGATDLEMNKDLSKFKKMKPIKIINHGLFVYKK